jgi:hypothetical protein
VGFASRSPSFAQPALLASLRSQSPFIRRLALCLGDSGESLDANCEVLSGLRELSHLETGKLSRQEFLRLTPLSAIKSLCFTLGTYDIHDIQSDCTPTILPQLDQVQFTLLMQYIAVAGCFRESVRLPSCLSVMLYINYDGLGNDPEVLYDPTHPQPHRLPLGVPLSCS